MLNIDLRTQIKNYALENKGREICGLILSSGDSLFVYKCKNISSNQEKFFELSSLDYLRAWDGGKNKIVGMFHSQESVKPSPLDIINYQNHKIPSYIYSFDADDIVEVTNQHLKHNKYLGRPFEIGRDDCFGLIKDFYSTEFNININDFPRTDKWVKDNPKYGEHIYQKEGFIKVDLENIIDGNILEFSFGHYGIYLDGDFLLHHQRSKLSNIEKFDNIWKKRTTNVYKRE